jgi:hypothetical protein
MTYQTTITADAPYIYIPFTSNSVANNGGSKTGMTNTASGLTYGTSDTFKGACGILSGSTSFIQYTIGTDNLFNGAYTIEAWIKAGTQASYANIVHREEGNSKIAFRIDAPSTTNANKLVLEYRGTTGSVSKTIVGPVITDNAWHHIVVTDDRTNVIMYVDGVQVATNTSNTAAAFVSSTWRIGAYGTGSANENYAGSVDEVALWKSALTATQVQNHYNAGLGISAVSVAAPVMTASLAAVNPSAAYAQKEVTVAAPAMDAGLVEFNPAGIITETISQTVSLVSTSQNGASADTITGSNPNSYNTYTFNTFTIPTGYQVISARMDFYVESASSPATLRVQTWNAGNTARVNSGDPDASFTGTTARFIDVTKAVQAKGNVLVLSGYTGGTGSLVIDNQNAFSSKRPTLTVQMAAVPALDKTVVAPVMTASIAAPAPVVSNTKNPTVDVPAMSASVDAVAPGVSVSGSTSVSVPVINAGSLEFTGGLVSNPDATVFAGAMIVALTSPNATQYVAVHSVNDVPATYFGNLESEPATVSLTTGRIAFPPAMTMTLKWPGIYVEQGDRYLALLNSKLTNSLNDVWYKLGGETPGASRLVDSANGGNTGFRYDGYVLGAPDFNIPDGPQLRKAARFDGIDDYIVVGPYSRNGIYDNLQNIKTNDHAVTIEFSIRTTQLNGTVFNGTGGGDGGFASVSPTYFALPNIQHKLNLRNGYLHVIDDMLGTKILTRSGFVSDGEWHHIVMSVPALKGPRIDPALTAGPSYLMVDGQVVLQTYGIAGGEVWAPYAFMADADFNATAGSEGAGYPLRGKNVTGYLAGDLRDVIVRLNTYVDKTTSTKAYYEWSDSVISNAEPITLNLTAVNPFKARGDAKRMLAIFGLPIGYNGATGQFTGGEPIYAYQSKFSAFCIESFESDAYRALNYHTASPYGWERSGQNGNLGSWAYRIPASFTAGPYTVYPVSITGKTPSLDGIRNPDSEAISTGQFVDYETGLPRFINLQEDLAEPLSNYDAITVLNYPWVAPDGFDVPKTGYNNPSTNDLVAPEFGLWQNDMGLTNAEWGVARDNLRDSLLQAIYDGANLWIGEYHMAQHLGFIGDVDFHGTGMYFQEHGDLAHANWQAEALDAAHFRNGHSGSPNDSTHGFYFYPQVNFYRRIVAEVPDLTDLPSTEQGNFVEGWSANDFEPNGSWFAYDIVKRPNGLQVGDKMRMDILFRLGTEWEGQTEGQGMTQFAQSKRHNIVSARPEGIVGRVVSREIESYFGPGKDEHGNPVVIDNPYKNNAYTIAVERGSVVKGRPIRGRVFIELMEEGAHFGGVAEDKDKNKWHGDVDSLHQGSTWAKDSRRGKEIKLQNVSTGIVFPTKDGEGDIKVVTKIQYYMAYETSESISYTNVNMHMRGLNWLASVADTNGDDFIGYAAPITVNLTTPAPVHSNSKNPVSEVIGAMRLDLEVRQPANYRDGSVMERTLPMELRLEMRGIGKTTQVPPMVVSLSTVAPVIDAETETIVLFMDNTDTLTLFIKEEN